MAVAAYTTDLTDIADLDTTGGTAVEPSSLYTAGRSPVEDDTDFPIQGTVHASLTFNTTGKGGILVPGTSWTYTSGDYIFGWLIWLAPSTIATQASGGLVMLLGSSATVFDAHYVGGSDYGAYPYGGWQNFVVDPERTPDENAGTPTAYHYVGTGANCTTKVAKGNPLGFDVFRYGRGEARIVGGTSTDTDASFSGLAAINDNNSNRWGLFQEIEGGYKFKGKLIIGYGAACDFTDSDKSIVIDNTEMVDADFNRIEITNATSVVNWTNISFSALGTISKGQLEMMDDCTFNDTGGVFTGMDTFIYDSNYTGIGRTFRRCGQVTLGGASMTACIFADSTAAISLACGSSISTIADCDFESDGSNHGLEITSGTSHTLDNLKFTGYETYNVNGTSTGNEAVYVNIPTGSVTLYADTLFSYRTAGATVTVVAGSVDTVVTAISVDGTGVNDVSIALYAKDATGDLPFQESVTISNATTTATVTHTTHGMITNDKILIRGGNQPYNRGTFTITVTDVNTYTYTTSTAPSGDPTGCTSTWTSIYEVLSSTNTITKSRTFTSPQPVSGWVRKSTTSPLYKTAPITGTISITLGLNLTGLMLSDE